MTVAQKIQEITRAHLVHNNGVVLGQCLTAVGWVGGTVPEMREEDGLIELATSDSSNSGIAVGLALALRRPIYIVRYQGFQWYNAATIVNYAAKSKDMWGIPCPVFVRSIAMEGGVGPVASNSHHGMFMRMPGIPICAPMTPGEYEHVWNYFMTHDDPVYVSEHRKSFGIEDEMADVVHEEADVTLYAISVTRLDALAASRLLQKEGILCNVIHVVWLKPFVVDERILAPLRSSRYGGIVLDDDYENGAAKCLAFDMMQKSESRVGVMGLRERAAGFAPQCDNLSPSVEEICARVRSLVKKNQ